MTRRRKSRRGPCPTPELARYVAQIDAQLALRRTPATYFTETGELRHRRVYGCVCKGWHITPKD